MRRPLRHLGDLYRHNRHPRIPSRLDDACRLIPTQPHPIQQQTDHDQDFTAVFRTLIGAAGIFTCAAAPKPTAALSAETLPTRNVVYADLDLNTSVGQKELDCRELALIAEANRCLAEAIAKARSKIEAKTVLASR